MSTTQSTPPPPRTSTGTADPATPAPSPPQTDEPTAPATPSAPPPLLRNRSYMLLMTGLTTESLGAGLALFAVPLVAYSLTGSVLQAGAVAAVGQVGALLATLPAGVVADRVDRRRLVVAASTVGAALWVTVGAAAALGSLTAWHLALVLFGASVVGAFVDPATSGAFRSVVPAPQLPTALAATQGRDAVASLLAGPVGGLLFAVGHAVPLAAAAIGSAATAVCTWAVREPLNGDTAQARATHPVEALRHGLRFVWSVPLFRTLLGLFVVINVAFGGLLVGINLELVRTGVAPVLIGVIDLAVGAGILVGAVLAPQLVARVRAGALTVAALVTLAVGATLMAALQTYPAYVAVLPLAVLLVPAVNAGLAGYAAAITPLDMQGRLASIMGLTGLAAGPLIPLVGAGLLDRFGIGTALVVLAGLLVATVAVISAARPLWRVGTPDTWADDALPSSIESGA
ncbi:MFS transporter [Oerskovia turbata]|uniref:MFS transporter n=1 Tax=Oerskovia turbata TaxID=1713 RepID=A0A4Q1KZA6_9CELL|nr:MFS transporter [Oerskovia turbata]RXR25099.1 MFS transporter [Oerskovia turbata]RXR35245.1 MFS transporter [Oerskovia turbata]